MEIPVRYRLEQENPNVLVLHCEVGLSEAERPEWMKTGNWSVRSIYSEGAGSLPGVTVTELSALGGRSMDEHLFIAAANGAVENADAEYREWVGH